MSSTLSWSCNLLFRLIESLLVILRIRDPPPYSLKEKDWQTTKLDRIQTCLLQNPVNLWELREMALSRGGLMTSEYRQQGWPLLVGLDLDDLETEQPEEVDETEQSEEVLSHDLTSPTSVLDTEELFPEQEQQQQDKQQQQQQQQQKANELIRRDVGRSVIFQYNNYYDETTTPSFAGERLATVLESVVDEKSGNLHYYQGLHDVVGVLLHNLDYQTPLTTKLVQTAVSQAHFRDAMRENFGNITWMLSLLMLPLIEQIDKHVHYALHQVELSTLCLPWVITWFTHDVYHPPTAARLADAFLAGHPLLPLYFAVALLTHPVLKQELLAEQDCDDPATMFVILKKLPMAIASDDCRQETSRQRKVPVQELLEDALSILKKYPPRSLLNLVDADFDDLLHRVSSISALRTPNAWRITSGKKLTFHVASQQQEQVKVPLFVRAKLASGVPIIHQEIPDSCPVLKSQSWGSQRYLRRKGRPKWKKYTKRLLKRLKSKLKTS